MFEPLLYVFLILFWLSVQISIKDFIIACKSDHFPSHFHLSVHCLHENWLEMRDDADAVDKSERFDDEDDCGGGVFDDEDGYGGGSVDEED